VSLVFTQVTFETPPGLSTLAGKLLRGCLYLPYLFWEIGKANVALAYLALHPSLPIDPEIGDYEPALREPLPVTVLAISITLTPGTLVLDDRGDGLQVHSMTPDAFRDLLEGRLDRAVSYVFHGRQGMVDGTTDTEDSDG
jgi:multicomponent Na+:H+ antiporter subunit E